MEKSNKKIPKELVQELVLLTKEKETKNENAVDLYIKILGFVPRISLTEKSLCKGLLDGVGHLYLEEDFAKMAPEKSLEKTFCFSFLPDNKAFINKQTRRQERPVNNKLISWLEALKEIVNLLINSSFWDKITVKQQENLKEILKVIS
ncbi:MAG: hypothetical protein WCJ57_02165 [Candidatus Falkowbacteria bacterium]